VLCEDVLVGYCCKLCDWHTQRGDPYTFQYDPDAQEEAKELFKMHVKDAHPKVYPELYPEEP